MAPKAATGHVKATAALMAKTRKLSRMHQPAAVALYFAEKKCRQQTSRRVGSSARVGTRLRPGAPIAPIAPIPWPGAENLELVSVPWPAKPEHSLPVPAQSLGIAVWYSFINAAREASGPLPRLTAHPEAVVTHLRSLCLPTKDNSTNKFIFAWAALIAAHSLNVWKTKSPGVASDTLRHNVAIVTDFISDVLYTDQRQRNYVAFATFLLYGDPTGLSYVAILPHFSLMAIVQDASMVRGCWIAQDTLRQPFRTCVPWVLSMLFKRIVDNIRPLDQEKKKARKRRRGKDETMAKVKAPQIKSWIDQLKVIDVAQPLDGVSLEDMYDVIRKADEGLDAWHAADSLLEAVDAAEVVVIPAKSHTSYKGMTGRNGKRRRSGGAKVTKRQRVAEGVSGDDEPEGRLSEAGKQQEEDDSAADADGSAEEEDDPASDADGSAEPRRSGRTKASKRQRAAEGVSGDDGKQERKDVTSEEEDNSASEAEGSASSPSKSPTSSSASSSPSSAEEPKDGFFGIIQDFLVVTSGQLSTVLSWRLGEAFMRAGLFTTKECPGWAAFTGKDGYVEDSILKSAVVIRKPLPHARLDKCPTSADPRWAMSLVRVEAPSERIKQLVLRILNRLLSWTLVLNTEADADAYMPFLTANGIASPTLLTLEGTIRKSDGSVSKDAAESRAPSSTMPWHIRVDVYQSEIQSHFGRELWGDFLKEATEVQDSGFKADRPLNLFRGWGVAKDQPLLGRAASLVDQVKKTRGIELKAFVDPEGKVIDDRNEIARLWTEAIAAQPAAPACFYVPNIGANDLLAGPVKQTLLRIGAELMTLSVERILSLELQHDARLQLLDEDPPRSGFAVGGFQLFVKSGSIAVTPLHNEDDETAAINFMLPKSEGTALWVGVLLDELTPWVEGGQATVNSWIDKQDSKDPRDVLQELINIRAKARRARAKRIPQLTFLWQRPGDEIHSPAGINAAHFVISSGRWVEQLATNAWNAAEDDEEIEEKSE